MLKIGILGFNGRVGQLLKEEIAKSQDLLLSAVFFKNGATIEAPKEVVLSNSWEVFLQSSEVVIDFSSVEGTKTLLQEALKIPKPLVIGTTGLDEEGIILLQKASEKMPVVYATNTSKGVALLNQLVFLASKLLDQSDIEICEIHHNQKKDSPSGTAMTLAQHCAKARNLDLSKVCVSGRDGVVGARKKDEIGVMSLRGGDIVGRHTVGFYCEGEYLELTHNATNRKTFALGALDAARWVVKQEKGCYGMQDVLGLFE